MRHCVKCVNIKHIYLYKNYFKYAVVWKWLRNWPLWLNKTTMIGQSTKTDKNYHQITEISGFIHCYIFTDNSIRRSLYTLMFTIIFNITVMENYDKENGILKMLDLLKKLIFLIPIFIFLDLFLSTNINCLQCLIQYAQLSV